MRSKIIYVYDPLCGWCYGFSSVMKKIQSEFKNDIDFDIISGGMVIGDQEGPVGDFANYILNTIPRVEDYTGVTFGEPYKEKLKDKSFYQSSLKPCIALEAFKTFNTKDAIFFASSLQEEVYLNGNDLQHDSIYKKLIKPFGIDETGFLEKLNSEDLKKQTIHLFLTVEQWGITGFPAVIFQKEQQHFLISKGYSTYDVLKATIEKILAE